MTARAVVFDCDGVLVDSEPVLQSIWAQVVARYGYEVTADDEQACLGRNERSEYAYLAERADLPAWGEFIGEIRALEGERYFADLRAFPDAVGAVRALAGQGVPLAVGSSSPRRRVEPTLALTDVARYFEVVVAGDDLRNGAMLASKPDPDIYLAAAARLRVDPVSCIAIEDSQAGVEAASAAGMRVIAVAREGAPPVSGAATVDAVDPELILVWMGLR